MSKDKIKVLLVEDELTLAMIIKDTLEESDFIIHTAANGEEGLRLFFDLRPDVLVADVMIPHIPPTMMTFAITAVPNAFAIASAVTSPVPASELRISDGFST